MRKKKNNNDIYTYNKNDIVIFSDKNYKNRRRNTNSKIELNDNASQKNGISNITNSTEKRFIKIRRTNPITNL